MRLVLAAIFAATAALPAHAQRVDTRVIDIAAEDGGTSCRFNAMQDLKMVHGPARTYARWAHKASDGGAILHASFTPAQPQGLIEYIEVPAGEMPAKAANATLLLDGEEVPGETSLGRSRAANRPARILPDDGVALAAAMRYTDTLGLVLYDARGVRLRSYEFWIGDLQNVAEYPSIIHWQCRNF